MIEPDSKEEGLVLAVLSPRLYAQWLIDHPQHGKGRPWTKREKRCLQLFASGEIPVDRDEHRQLIQVVKDKVKP